MEITCGIDSHFIPHYNYLFWRDFVTEYFKILHYMRNGNLALAREKVSLCVVFGQLSKVNLTFK